MKLSPNIDTSLHCPRLLLSDEHRSKLREILLYKTICNKRDIRMTVKGMLYRMRTRCPWRDLSRAFRNWNKVYKRFNAWSASGKWFKVSKRLVVEPDMEWVFIDGNYAKAHQHSAGAASGSDEAVGQQGAKAVIPRKRNSVKGHADSDRGACAFLWLPM